MRAATFAQQIGRTVAFSLAAFRQAFAAGRDLSDMDNVVIAAAACELHPKRAVEGDRDPGGEGPPEGGHGRGVRARGARGAHGALWETSSSGATTGWRGPRRAPEAYSRPRGHRVHPDSMATTKDHPGEGGGGTGSGSPAHSSPMRHLPPRARQDDAHPPLRGARGRDVREGQDRRSNHFLANPETGPARGAKRCRFSHSLSRRRCSLRW